MEEKYFLLKRLIYEACRETENINNGCIPNRHPKPNEDVIPVVSKRLYDEIRKKLLPYDTNLFYFGLKMVWSIAFSLGIFVLINMLNKFNVTGLVQVITTASLGVMPHIFNMVESKTNEERKKANNEKLKLNVKYRVEESIRKNLKLYHYLIKNGKRFNFKHIARTVLILKQEIQGNKTTPYHFSVCESLKYVSGWYLLEIDDVENDQQAPQKSGNTHDIIDGNDGKLAVIVHRNRKTMIDDIEDSEEKPLVQQNNDVIVEENNQNSGNTHDNIDSDDGKLAVIVHRNRKTMIDDIEDSEEKPLVQQNNDVIVEENNQNSENTHDNVDNDDGKLAVIVRKNRKTTIDDIEDSEKQPLVQQNNDTIVEENDQNSGNTHDNVDSDDGKLAVTVHWNRKTMIDDIEDSEEKPLVQQNNDVIVEENNQNSLNTHDNVDSDDGKLAVIVHRNRKTMIDDIEDSEKQPLVQQSNDVTVNENDQNSVFEYCK